MFTRRKGNNLLERKQRISGSAADDEAAIMGILERGGGNVPSRVHARTIRDANAKVLQSASRANAEPGSMLMTDSLMSYRASALTTCTST